MRTLYTVHFGLTADPGFRGISRDSYSPPQCNTVVCDPAAPECSPPIAAAAAATYSTPLIGVIGAFVVVGFFLLSFFPNRGFRTAALIRANYSGVVRLARTDCPAGVAAVNTQKEHETESDHGTATSTIFILLF